MITESLIVPSDQDLADYLDDDLISIMDNYTVSLTVETSYLQDLIHSIVEKDIDCKFIDEIRKLSAIKANLEELISTTSEREYIAISTLELSVSQPLFAIGECVGNGQIFGMRWDPEMDQWSYFVHHPNVAGKTWIRESCLERGYQN